MTISRVVLVVVCVLVLAFQLYVTVRLIRYSGYSTGQAVVQLFIVWLIPLFGAWIVNAVISFTIRPIRGADRDFSPDAGNNPSGIGSP